MADLVKLGDELGFSMEPNMLYARVVGLRKDGCRPIETVIIRRYRPGDRLGIPTGEHCTTWMCVRYEPPEKA